eukprot:gene6232-biopygen6602
MFLEQNVVKNSMKVKKKFIRYISHEIRTPLNAVSLGLKYLHDVLPKYILDPDILDSVVTSQSACSVSVNILTDLLTFDKIEDGELKLDRQDVSVADLVLASTAIFQAQAREKGVMLTTEIAFDPRPRLRTRNDVAAENDMETRPEPSIPVKTCQDVKAFVDRAKMSQVIHNLVSNGLKFTPPGGHVSVTVTVEEEPPSPRGNLDTSPLLPLRVKNESASGSPIVAGPVFVKITVKDTGAGLSQRKPRERVWITMAM